MTHEIDYSIQDFSHESDIKLLKEIYLLNQANTPEVGNLNSVSQLPVSYTHLTLPTKA